MTMTANQRMRIQRMSCRTRKVLVQNECIVGRYVLSEVMLCRKKCFVGGYVRWQGGIWRIRRRTRKVWECRSGKLGLKWEVYC